jgi:hypothetical protein
MHKSGIEKAKAPLGAFLFCATPCLWDGSSAEYRYTTPSFTRNCPMKKLILLMAAFCLSGIAFAASVEDDVNFYSQAFAEGKSVDPALIESLAWKGVSDPRVFDPLERRIAQRAEEGHNDRRVKNEVALYMRALGFSGQAKYRPLLEQYKSDLDYGKYARDALAEQPNYQRWNPVISNRANFDPAYSDEVNRIRNMLLADDFDLKKLGAKRVYYENKDAVLLDVLAEQLRANYMTNEENKSDSVAWMAKALGSAHQAKYRPLIEEVATRASDNAIARHARKALKN